MPCRKYPRTLKTRLPEKLEKGVRGHQAPVICTLSHGEEVGGVGEGRRGFEGEGLRKRDARSSKLEERRERESRARLSSSGSPGEDEADWPADTLTRMTRGSRAAGGDSLGDGHWWAAICKQSSGITRQGHAETGPFSCSFPASLSPSGVAYGVWGITSILLQGPAMRRQRACLRSTLLVAFAQFPLITGSKQSPKCVQLLIQKYYLSFRALHPTDTLPLSHVSHRLECIRIFGSILRNSVEYIANLDV